METTVCHPEKYVRRYGLVELERNVALGMLKVFKKIDKINEKNDGELIAQQKGGS